MPCVVLHFLEGMGREKILMVGFRQLPQVSHVPLLVFFYFCYLNKELKVRLLLLFDRV